MDVTEILTSEAPAPFGHYVQATAFRDLLFISGQLPALPDGTQRSDADFENQVRQCLRNLVSVVTAGGGTLASILKVTAYIVGVENWPAFNRVYSEVFGAAKPARSVVPVSSLHHGYLVEMEAIAAVERWDT